MRKIILTLCLCFAALSAWAQQTPSAPHSGSYEQVQLPLVNAPQPVTSISVPLTANV